MTRRIVKTPKQSLREILEQQLERLSVVAENRLLDPKETRLLQILSPISQMDLKDEEPKEVLSAVEVEELERLARGH